MCLHFPKGAITDILNLGYASHCNEIISQLADILKFCVSLYSADANSQICSCRYTNKAINKYSISSLAVGIHEYTLMFNMQEFQ